MKRTKTQERAKRTSACSQENRTGGHQPEHRQRLDGRRGSDVRGYYADYPNSSYWGDSVIPAV